MSKNKYFRIICLFTSLVMIFSVITMEMINSAAYEAEKTVEEAMESSKYVTVEDKVDYIVFEPVGDFYDKGIIFYPGGSVEPEAYAPLMHAVAEEGYFCVIVKMPLNLAVLDADKADEIREDYPNIADWYMSGHSLGGAMSATYAHENASQIKGVILLAAYSTEDLSKDNLEVLSIYGSLDDVLNMENYEKYRSNLPADMTELVISGGNHANFGNYGAQKDDGFAELSAEDQQTITVEAICEMLK